MAVVTILTGVGAGCGGMLLALLPHASQHVAYGYSLAHGGGSESFLTGVTQADPLRLSSAGGGWWALYRYGGRSSASAGRFARPIRGCRSSTRSFTRCYRSSPSRSVPEAGTPRALEALLLGGESAYIDRTLILLYSD